jgi:hypothetical protein
MSAVSLSEALQFTPDDLAANREGRLSAAQSERLRHLRRRSVMVGLSMIVLIGLVAAALLFVALRNQSGILQLVGIGVTITNAAITGVLARNWLRLSGDLRDGRASALTGEARHTIRVTGRIANYLLRVEREEMNVSKPVFFAFEEGRRYRFYRAPASRVLLSAEPI